MGIGSERAANWQWWTCFNRSDAPSVRLFCCPYAGGSAAMFSGWSRALPSDVEVYGLQLPGRGGNIRTKAYTRMERVVPRVAAAVANSGDRPVILFGHSLGALIAFEVSRYLSTVYRKRLGHLIVSGRRAPHRPSDEPPRYQSSDAALVDALRELNGTPPEVLENEDLLQLMLPTVRADFEMAETYRYVPGAPLDCDITVLRGELDEETSDDEAVTAWASHSNRQVRVHTFSGDHFFVTSNESDVLSVVRGIVQRLTVGTTA